jgi:hypothetical protein
LLTPEQLELATRLEGIFLPHATRQRLKIFQDHARFIHYTSAESALSIIKTKRVWMRNTICMADYREVQRGREIFERFFATESHRTEFIGALDSCVVGVALEGIKLFDEWWTDTRFNTYITAISEHDETEDLDGRLSMWRAFGGNTSRVGIVFKIPLNAPLSLNLMLSPVSYLSEDSAHQVLLEVAANVRGHRDFLCTVDRTVLVRTIFFMLVASVVCLKHTAFHEEREWRAIYAPKRWPSPLMESSTEVIAGLPQIVYRIPLDVNLSESLADLEFSRIFDRLIVGPTAYPWPIFEAFSTALTKAGIADAGSRVFVSTIPIRT